jgi:hypothetical protein
MKKRPSIGWGNWLREPKQQPGIIEAIQRVSKRTRFWLAAAVLFMIILVSAGILINYVVGLKTSENIDASTRQMADASQAFIRQTLTAINPNDFSFKPLEDGDWYAPAPADAYVKLNILPVQSKKLSLNFSVKNRSEYPARNVYCMIFFSSKEFVESGNDIVKVLKGIEGLNAYAVDSSNDYLDQAAAFEWLSIPPKTQKSVARTVGLTMRGATARLTVRINSVNRLAFEFRHNDG